MTLPSIQLADVSSTMIFSVAFNPQRFNAQRSSIGMQLLLPAMPTTHLTAQLLQVQGTLGFPNERAGLAIPTQIFTNSSQYAYVPITDDQVARIERVRAGGQLTLEVQLEALAMVGDSLRPLRANYFPTVTIPREDWLRILQQLDVGKRRLIELPAAPQCSGLWSQSSEAIERASWRLASGDAGGAMSESRTAFERLIEAVGDASGRPRTSNDRAVANYANAVVDILNSRHAPRSGDPYAVLANSIRLVLHGFNFASEIHGGLSRIERVNAELALSLVTTLYTYVSQVPLFIPSDAPSLTRYLDGENEHR